MHASTEPHTHTHKQTRSTLSACEIGHVVANRIGDVSFFTILATNNGHHVFYLPGFPAIANAECAVSGAMDPVALVNARNQRYDGRGSGMGVTGDGNDDLD